MQRAKVNADLKELIVSFAPPRGEYAGFDIELHREGGDTTVFPASNARPSGGKLRFELGGLSLLPEKDKYFVLVKTRDRDSNFVTSRPFKFTPGQLLVVVQLVLKPE